MKYEGVYLFSFLFLLALSFFSFPVHSGYICCADVYGTPDCSDNLGGSCQDSCPSGYIATGSCIDVRCSTDCEEGSTKVVGTTKYECKAQDNGCRDWVAVGSATSQICSPGDKKIENGAIYSCSSDGSSWVYVSSVDNGGADDRKTPDTPSPSSCYDTCDWTGVKVIDGYKYECHLNSMTGCFDRIQLGPVNSGSADIVSANGTSSYLSVSSPNGTKGFFYDLRDYISSAFLNPVGFVLNKTLTSRSFMLTCRGSDLCIFRVNVTYDGGDKVKDYVLLPNRSTYITLPSDIENPTSHIYLYNSSTLPDNFTIDDLPTISSSCSSPFVRKYLFDKDIMKKPVCPEGYGWTDTGVTLLKLETGFGAVSGARLLSDLSADINNIGYYLGLKDPTDMKCIPRKMLEDLRSCCLGENYLFFERVKPYYQMKDPTLCGITNESPLCDGFYDFNYPYGYCEPYNIWTGKAVAGDGKIMPPEQCDSSLPPCDVNSTTPCFQASDCGSSVSSSGDYFSRVFSFIRDNWLKIVAVITLLFIVGVLFKNLTNILNFVKAIVKW